MTVFVIKVQSLVQDNFDEVHAVNVQLTDAHEELYSVHAKNTQFVATLLVFTHTENLYFVDTFIGIAFLERFGRVTVHEGIRISVHAHVTSVVEIFAVNLHVLVTVLSNSKLAHAVVKSANIQYFSSSIHPSVVLAISPVALSILMRSHHLDAREVVVSVHAVLAVSYLIHIDIIRQEVEKELMHQ